MTDEQLIHIYNSGIALFQERNFAEAALKFQEVTAHNPENHQAWKLLGDCNFSNGHYSQASENYLKCERLNPGDLSCRYQLACSLMEDRHYQEAANWYKQVIANAPTNAKALCGYGISLVNCGHIPEGLDALKQAISIDPANHILYFNYGFLLHKTGKSEEAKAAFEQALNIKPGCVDALYGLGNIYTDYGMMKKAREYFRKATELEPNYYAPYSAIGFTWLNEHISKAIEFYKHALSINPYADDVLMRLGEAQQRIGEIEEANKSHRNAININPRNPAHYFSYSNLLISEGLITDAIKCCQKCLELDSQHHRAYSNLLMSLHYVNTISPQEIFNLHKDYAKFYCPKLDTKNTFNNIAPDPEKKLRIGFVSADFRRHSVSYFLLPLLKELENYNIEVIGYSNVRTPDDMTEQIRKHCGNWQNICGVSDEQAAEIISEDRIDILIDIAGHTADGRMLLFGKKPAPVAVTWLGYPDTTGLSAIDYRFIDKLTDPVKELTVKRQDGTESSFTPDQLCSEKLIRLDDCFLTYEPPQDTPEVSPPPFEKNGYITFGSFNNLAKLSDQTIQLWAGILTKMPESKLILKSRGLDDEFLKDLVIKRFAHFQIPAQQLEFSGFALTNQQHMQMYNSIDIALDTTPYNGTTTTCEALWMGVPVVTFPGSTHASRVGLSLLTAAGHSGLITKTPEEFVNTALKLAKSPEQLRSFRSNSRQHLAKSILMNHKGFARNFFNALRQIWTEYCQNAL